MVLLTADAAQEALHFMEVDNSLAAVIKIGMDGTVDDHEFQYHSNVLHTLTISSAILICCGQRSSQLRHLIQSEGFTFLYAVSLKT